jgi:hypothetical protein
MKSNIIGEIVEIESIHTLVPSKFVVCVESIDSDGISGTLVTSNSKGSFRWVDMKSFDIKMPESPQEAG